MYYYVSVTNFYGLDRTLFGPFPTWDESAHALEKAGYGETEVSQLWEITFGMRKHYDGDYYNPGLRFIAKIRQSDTPLTRKDGTIWPADELQKKHLACCAM